MIRFWTGPDSYIDLPLYRIRLEVAQGVRVRRDLAGNSHSVRPQQNLSDDRLLIEMPRPALRRTDGNSLSLQQHLEDALRTGSTEELFAADTGVALRFTAIGFPADLAVAQPSGEWRRLEALVAARGTFTDPDERGSVSY